MNNVHKFLSAFALVALSALALASPAQAFDGRSGDKVIIAADEVIDDDLYVTADEFTLDGTVNGDVVALGRIITINGTVDGDVMAAGQTIVVNGTITGAIRMAGSALLLGEQASIGGDIMAPATALRSATEAPSDRTLSSRAVKFCWLAMCPAMCRSQQARSNCAAVLAAMLRQMSENRPRVTRVPHPACLCHNPQFQFPQSNRVSRLIHLQESREIWNNPHHELAFPAGVIVGKTAMSVRLMKQHPAETTGKESKVGRGLCAHKCHLILLAFSLWLFPPLCGPEPNKSELLVQSRWVQYSCAFIALLFTVIVMILADCSRRIDIRWISRNDCLAWDSGVIRPGPRLCARHIVRRQNSIWSGARRMDPRPPQLAAG
jgi:cytoskeletal protein CcmA (bactofilin family)